ncbi:MAG: hypothetical protein RI985_1798, partial [Chloroflexota bacterium]
MRAVLTTSNAPPKTGSQAWSSDCQRILLPDTGTERKQYHHKYKHVPQAASTATTLMQAMPLGGIPDITDLFAFVH